MNQWNGNRDDEWNLVFLQIIIPYTTVGLLVCFWFLFKKLLSCKIDDGTKIEEEEIIICEIKFDQEEQDTVNDKFNYKIFDV